MLVETNGVCFPLTVTSSRAGLSHVPVEQLPLQRMLWRGCCSCRAAESFPHLPNPAPLEAQPANSTHCSVPTVSIKMIRSKPSIKRTK